MSGLAITATGEEISRLDPQKISFYLPPGQSSVCWGAPAAEDHLGAAVAGSMKGSVV